MNIIELENLSFRTWKFDNNINMIKQKGMPFDHDFGHSFPHKKEGRRKGEWLSKNREIKSCLSFRSINMLHVYKYIQYIIIQARFLKTARKSERFLFELIQTYNVLYEHFCQKKYKRWNHRTF